MEFRLLGPMEVDRDGTVLALGGVRQRVVLAALALHADRTVTADRLTDAVWAEPPHSAGSNLRTYVARLRRLLADPGGGSGPLVGDADGYRLVADGRTDVLAFGELADRGGRHVDRGDHAAAGQCFRQALALWRGRPLDGLPLGPGLAAEVTRLEERRSAVAERYARCRARLGEYPAAVEAFQELVAGAPLREDLWAQLMLALHRAGRPAEALAAYRRVHRLLDDELGVEPNAELRRLRDLILAAGRPTAVTPPDPSRIIGPGLHRPTARTTTEAPRSSGPGHRRTTTGTTPDLSGLSGPGPRRPTAGEPTARTTPDTSRSNGHGPRPAAGKRTAGNAPDGTGSGGHGPRKPADSRRHGSAAVPSAVPASGPGSRTAGTRATGTGTGGTRATGTGATGTRATGTGATGRGAAGSRAAGSGAAGTGAHGGGRAAARRQLPADIAEFTGRAPQLRQLHRLGGSRSTAVAVCAIRGMAGVGKTRLAVHAAHQITRSGRYDEIQLYADLHGFTPGRAPAAPADVLEGFLRLLGVAGRQIPADPAQRAALYRDRLHGRRALVLLDNAGGEDQVRPLLPGGSTALVLITSRHALVGLEGARQLSLDVFSEDEAVTLFARIAGAERVAAHPAATRRIVELCGRLPIAVALAARRLVARPSWTPAHLADRLEATDQRLGRLAAGSRALRTAFDLSYRALPAAGRRMFRLLALHPGDDVTAASAAALAGTTGTDAEAVLESLLDEYLLQQSDPGRYRLHNLLRIYAAERGEAEPEPVARDRVLGWYLHATHAADVALDPRRRRIDPDATAAPERAARFDGHDDALAWLEAERPNLVAAVHAARRAGLDALCWQLAANLLGFFYLRSHWDDWLSTHGVALASARRLGDRRAEAVILDQLGVAHSDLRRYDEALGCHQEALAAQRALGDRRGEGWTLNNLGVAYDDLRRYDEALDCFDRAVELFRSAGDRRGEGIALSNLGDTCRHLGRWADADRWLPVALAVQRGTGDRDAQRYTLISLGDLSRDRGRHATAERCYREALDITRAVGDRRAEARLLTRLGLTHRCLGRPGAARDCLREALAVLDDLGDPDATEVRAHLADIP